MTTLNQRDFEGSKNLTKITTVKNNISFIEAGVFDDVPQLELNSPSNNIKTLPALLFVELAKLETLSLPYNQLQSYFSELLPLNNVIEKFHVTNNKIQKISSANIMSLKTPKLIDLTDNLRLLQGGPGTKIKEATYGFKQFVTTMCCVDLFLIVGFGLFCGIFRVNLRSLKIMFSMKKSDLQFREFT